MHFPLNGYVLRRVRISSSSPVSELLTSAGVPSEADVVSEGTTVFEFPLAYGSGRTRSVKQVSIYEQAAVVTMLQRCWADNAVSNTLNVRENELGEVERVLALFAPQVKSMSLLPDRPAVYAQMPLEHLEPEEYVARAEALGRVQWEALRGSDGDAADSAYCTTDSCEVPVRA